jgi:hypothetical protein
MKGKIGKKTGEMLWRVLHDVDYKQEIKVVKHDNNN